MNSGEAREDESEARAAKKPRLTAGDDAHYFEGYVSSEVHQKIPQDRIRTRRCCACAVTLLCICRDCAVTGL